MIKIYFEKYIHYIPGQVASIWAGLQAVCELCQKLVEMVKPSTLYFFYTGVQSN